MYKYYDDINLSNNLNPVVIDKDYRVSPQSFYNITDLISTILLQYWPLEQNPGAATIIKNKYYYTRDLAPDFSKSLTEIQ